MKSTLAAINLVQMILCYPDIRILLLFGKLDKAFEILQLVKGYFLHPVFAHLFPDFAEGVKADKLEVFTTPARERLDLRDPTIAISSGRSIKAGSHADVILADDYTNEITGGSEMATLRAIERLDDVLQGVAEPQTQVIFLGSVWAPVDVPHVLRDNAGEDCDYFEQPVWTLRTDGPPEEVAGRMAREQSNALMEEDVIFAWPERLGGIAYWMSLYHKNPKNFSCQYLLRAEPPISDVRFSKELLVRQLCYKKDVPSQSASRFFINIDLAGGRGRRDETVLIVGNWDLSTKKLVLVDAVIRRGLATEVLAEMIVRYYLHYQPYRFRIENSPQALHLASAINQAAIRLGHRPEEIVIGWKTPSHARGAKRLRIQVFQKALADGKVQIWRNMPEAKKLLERLNRYNPTAVTGLDDVPDSCGQLYTEYEAEISAEIPVVANSCPILPEVTEFELDDLQAVVLTKRRLAFYQEQRAAEEAWRQLTPAVLETDAAGDPAYYKEQGVSNRMTEEI